MNLKLKAAILTVIALAATGALGAGLAVLTHLMEPKHFLYAAITIIAGAFIFAMYMSILNYLEYRK